MFRSVFDEANSRIYLNKSFSQSVFNCKRLEYTILKHLVDIFNINENLSRIQKKYHVFINCNEEIFNN